MCLQSFFLCWTWIWLSIESDNGCCCKSWLHPQKKTTKVMVCWDCFTKTIHICWCRLLIERNMGSNSFSILKTSNMMWRKQQLEALLLMYFKLLKSIQISCIIGFKGETYLCWIRRLLVAAIFWSKFHRVTVIIMYNVVCILCYIVSNK